MPLSRRASLFLIAVGVWTWLIWPNFLRNIAKDARSFDDGPTEFFLIHLLLAVTSIVIGTAVGAIGWRHWRSARANGQHDRALRSLVSDRK